MRLCFDSGTLSYVALRLKKRMTGLCLSTFDLDRAETALARKPNSLERGLGQDL